MQKINFASDNYAGIHPDILQAIIKANVGAADAYGGDGDTLRAVENFRGHFGKEVEVFFVFNGTAANVTGISSLIKSYQAVICANTAHIQMDECGAPEKYIGSKLLILPTHDGKLGIDQITERLDRLGDQHHVQAKVISISQTTEYGTVYTVNEIAELAAFAHDNDMYLHMDGARISNAAAALNLTFNSITTELGVDVLSFGGTKNGLMFGEAVIFLNPQLAKDFLYIRKQSMQLASKMRFIAAQFNALLTDALWKHNANHANKMASLLADKLYHFETINITQKVEANAIFAIMPPQLISSLHEKFNFHVWNEKTSEVRLMTSFTTTEEEVLEFSKSLGELI